MDMSNFRPEIHVAQQSRRDKLRFHHVSNPPNHHPGVFYDINNMNQLPAGTICYDPSGICSETIDFSELAQKNVTVAAHHHEPKKQENFNHRSDTLTINRDPKSSTCKSSIGSQSTTNGYCWAAANQTPNYVAEGQPCSSTFEIINRDNPAMPALDTKPYNVGYHELHSPLSNDKDHQSSEIFSQKQYYGSNAHCSSSSFYHHALQELVTTSNVRSFVPTGSLRQKSSDETSHGPWVVNGGEHLLRPAYVDQSGLSGPDDLISRPPEAHQWNGELDRFAAAKGNANPQALSLSLSSVPSPQVHATQVADRDNAMDLQSRDVFSSNYVQDFRSQNFPTGGNALQEMMGTQYLSNHRNPGPLGPFTGYATILRSSKFLGPAQILLEELYCVAGPKNGGICEGLDKILAEVGVFGEGVISNGEHGMKATGGDSSGWMDSYRPENLQKKAKLLSMQDEVYKKYQQYHQQMQMVVSSFEPVAGLGAAAPYVPLALKMVSKHFRCVKNAITDQLKSINYAFGEELPSHAVSTSSSKGDGSMVKFFDQSFQKQKGASNNVGILEGQHIWRPQRGLPERAVSVLRAWLFDHFLHPYPTDTDKHMLATQTGLTRNQVSNWFINARVRVWKPMVEEIHTLETKAMSADTRSDGKTTISDSDQANDSARHCSNTFKTSKIPDNYSSDVDLSEHALDSSDPISTWNQEKRSRVDYQVPTRIIDGSLMGLVPSHQTVSLTLGLRQGAENGQRPHYGGRIIRDFVG